MPSPPRAARSRPALLLAALTLAAALGACSRDAAVPPAPGPPPPRARIESPPAARRPLPDAAPATPAPARPPAPRPAAMVFDTVAPPAPAARPEVPRAPRPPRPPAPPRAPRPTAAAREAPAGSCDVRPSDSYCFAYAGPAWTAASASANCAGAPGATYRAAPCPTAGRIATCVFRRASEPDRELVYTTYAPADLDLARLACPGAFTVTEDATDR